MCIYIQMLMYIHTHIHTYTYTHIYAYTYTFAYVYAHLPKKTKHITLSTEPHSTSNPIQKKPVTSQCGDKSDSTLKSVLFPLDSYSTPT